MKLKQQLINILEIDDVRCIYRRNELLRLIDSLKLSDDISIVHNLINETIDTKNVKRLQIFCDTDPYWVLQASGGIVPMWERIMKTECAPLYYVIIQNNELLTRTNDDKELADRINDEYLRIAKIQKFELF